MVLGKLWSFEYQNGKTADNNVIIVININAIIGHSAPSTNLMNLEKTLTGPSQGDRALLGDSEYIFVEILPIQKLKD